jgi:hypothetical protein
MKRIIWIIALLAMSFSLAVAKPAIAYPSLRSYEFTEVLRPLSVSDFGRNDLIGIVDKYQSYSEVDYSNYYQLVQEVERLQRVNDQARIRTAVVCGCTITLSVCIFGGILYACLH